MANKEEFTKQELQLLNQTLSQRREWLMKNMHKPELANIKKQNEHTLQVIESALLKISANLFSKDTTHEGRDAVTHYVSQPNLPSNRQMAIERRKRLLAEDIKVLVVDDDQLIGELMNAYLCAFGIVQIDIVNDGLKGINMMFNANPIYDLVLCDWNMPGKSGIDVHNAMRAAERYQHTIFMLVTAVTEASQIRNAIEEGVNDYVVKPIEQEKLAKKIARFFPSFKESNVT
jgi:two-component system, chemotaxis family, chemotaxis protein CheY